MALADSELSLAIRLWLEARGLSAGFEKAGRDIQGFGRKTRKEMGDTRSSIRAIEGELVKWGAGYKALQGIAKSAALDKNLTLIAQTAGAGRKETEALRGELFRMAKETGQEVEKLAGGFEQLVQAGMNWKEAGAAIEAINPVLAISKASAEDLAKALSTAATSFEFDLSDVKVAKNLLDQMVMAGSLGSAELNNLPDVFARVGVNARAAGMDFSRTLGFIETLSQFEKNPERLSTLADSTLRLFTNQQYKRRAMSATGVDFYDAKGGARDPFAVLSDISQRYRGLKTTAQRDQFIEGAFGKTDLDTRRGLRMLLQGNSMNTAREFTTRIAGASGEVAKRLDDALDNAVDQSKRLKTALRDAAESFAQPINKAVSSSLKFLMDKKEQGGLELSGGQMLLGAAALVGGGLLGKKLLKGKFGTLAGAGNVAAGVATGKALEQMGVTPVYVVNMPGGGLGGGLAEAAAGGLGGRLPGAILRGGMKAAYWTGRAIPWLAGPALSYAAGDYAGSKIYSKGLEGTSVADAIGKAITHALAPFSEHARETLRLDEQYRKTMSGELTIRFDSKGRPVVESMRSEGMEIDVQNGALMGEAP